MPSHIIFTDGSSIVYEYAADGSKVRTMHTINNHVMYTVYCGNAIYEKGSLKMLLNEAGKVDDVNDYYPFGGLMSSSSSSVHLYKYNGKELDRKSGLDCCDYGARMYDAALGRWHVVDLMAEKYHGWSVYNYCANNPIKNIDPDGKQVIPVPMSYAPLPLYSPITYHQSYNLPSDQQIMRHASGKFAEIGQIITNAPWMSYVFGSLLYYQAKKAISSEFDHQRKRDRRGKEELDRNQANIAKSIDANVSGMMPNGDPAPKRELSISQKNLLEVV